jgi:trimethylamine--corrinoid protein Co-methyltransferase
MAKGFTRNIKPLEMLTDEQVEAIHRATLDVLRKTGVRFEHDMVLKLFHDNGCIVDYDKKIVKLPDYLVEECIRKAPSSFYLKARDPKNDLRIGGNTLYFYNSVGMRIVDLDTWESRPAKLSEQHDAVKVLDALENISMTGGYSPYADIEGIPPCMMYNESLASRIRYSTKVPQTGYRNDSEIFDIRMAKIVGIDVLGGVMASAPLTYYQDAIECTYRFAEAGFPIILLSGGMYGGSAPATIAGATITNNTELLAGLVLIQLLRPGLGILVADFTYPMDMQRGHPSFGALGTSLHGVMFGQIWRGHRIPHCFMTAGYSSSKKIDFQGAYERALNGLVGAVSGTNVMEFQGCVYGELTYHPIRSVLDDDIAGWIGRFIEGVQVTDETLAIDLINEVGPIPGHYLNRDHTRRLWKKEQFIPKAADRTSYPEWIEKGKEDAVELARKRVKEILETHVPTPLSKDQDKEIDKILEEARKYYKGKGLM